MLWIYLFYIPSTIIFLLIIPLGFTYFIYKNKKLLEKLIFKIKYGFIYNEYR
jgi:hypothetical protein